MDAEAIRDEGTLRAWLERRDRSGSVAIAHRCAMRVAPLWVENISPEGPQKLWIFRLNLLCSPILDYRDTQIRAATVAAARAVSQVPLAYVSPSATAGRSARTTFGAHRAARAAMVASEAYGAVTSASIDAPTIFGPVTPTAIWENLRADCNLLDAGHSLDHTPLWHAAPNPLQKAWDKTRTLWQAEAPTYDFWLRWYQGALDGTPLPPALLRDIALIPDAEWEKGAAHIAGLIAGIERDHALAATPNGEEVVFNPATGRLHLVPVTDLPTDIADYARRKITKAVALFDDDVGNQYAALAPDCAMLASAVADAGNLPVELFDACASAVRRLTARVKNGDCPPPETDPLIADYAARLREAGADILGHDAKTQEVLAARNAINGNDALIDGAAVILAAVGEIQPVTEGLLRAALAVDAKVATDLAANPEDRKVASYRLVSRMVRISKVLSWAVAGTIATVGGAIVGLPKVLEAIPQIETILASPYYQAVWQWLLRYLGY